MTTGHAARMTVHAGEADRADGGFLADTVLDRCVVGGVAAAVLLRGVQGFGARHRLRTDRLLSLSEDLPVVVVAVGEPGEIDGIAREVRALMPAGLLTVEPVALVRGVASGVDDAEDPDGDDAAGDRRLTVVVGRHARVGRDVGYVAVVAALQAAGVAGATVLLGVDGVVGGERRRARFAAGNADVPLLVVAVGGAGAIATAADRVRALLPEVVLVVEPVVVCKRDGHALAAPGRNAPPGWRRLTVHHGEQSRSGRVSLAQDIVPRLRAAGLAGATTLRGIWGYHGDHAPHGDRLGSLRRHVPVVTSVVETVERIPDAWAVIDELTDETGLVIDEPVGEVWVPGRSAGGAVGGGSRAGERPHRGGG